MHCDFSVLTLLVRQPEGYPVSEKLNVGRYDDSCNLHILTVSSVTLPPPSSLAGSWP